MPQGLPPYRHPAAGPGRWLAWLACLLWLAWLPAAFAAPVRVLVVTPNTHLLPAALAAFQRAHGGQVASLDFTTEAPDAARLQAADVVYTYYAPVDVLRRMADGVRRARQRGALVLAAPAQSAQAAWGIELDSAAGTAAQAYWEAGGSDNLAGFLAYVAAARQPPGAAAALVVPPVRPAPAAGIYHPRAPGPFDSLDAYLRWYRQAGPGPGAPLVGIAFYATNFRQGDLAQIDTLVDALERAGIGAVPVFGWPLSSLDRWLAQDGRTPLRLLLALNLTISRDPDKAWLERQGLHTLNLIATRDSRAAWQADVRGIAGERLPMLLNTPERNGASEPILFSTQEEVGGARASAAVPERVDAAVARVRRWLALQDKPAADKHIAILYYNNPPGRGNIGASYLATLPSLRAILQRLHEAGYDSGDNLPDTATLTALLEASGRNVETWSPGELARMQGQGRLTVLPLAQYRAWFAQLPPAFRAAVLRAWGPPERNPLMLADDGRGGLGFVIPGVRFGKLFLGPQPLRSTFERAMDTTHDTVTPPPHSYIAAYLWYRHAFGADAMVHVGRHGTLEWLPGKQVAQAGDDSAEVLLGDLPNAYYYIQDGGGEAIQAKRRGAAVLVSHLAPLLARAGWPAALAGLDQAIEQEEATRETSPELARVYREQALAQVRALGLERQLGLGSEAPWEEIEPAVHAFLHRVEAEPIPLGIYALGELPDEAAQRDGLATMLAGRFSSQEAEAIGPSAFARWAADLVAGREPAAPAEAVPPPLEAKAAEALAAGRQWLAALRASPRDELDGLVTVLSGRYLPSAPLGDPVRTPQSLPSGRNLHAFDGALIPTRAAWELGKTLAGQTLGRYQREHGRLPESVSMVLWYGETERHQGALESEALYLMGVEPVWNARGVVDDVRLIPDAELGRPRVNVLFTISGIYRDGFGDKVALLDKAARLAAAAGDNALSRHDRAVTAALLAAGTEAGLAGSLARARVFAAKPGNYAIGVSQMVEQSRDTEAPDAVAAQYLRYMNFAYSAEGWGTSAPQALASHLKDNQAVLFSRASTLYGALDNDDTYQYAGGLAAATRAAGGQAPAFWLHNLRTAGEARTLDARAWLATELNARNWNPKWIAAMQASGYAGAREMFKEIEHLYGFQAATPEQMSGQFWQRTYDVYVADSEGLGMEAFFRASNPHAQQWILSRLLEVDRQGSYRFSAAQRADMVRRYVASVARDGLSCSANTCGNPALMRYIEGLGRAADTDAQAMRRFAGVLAQATAAGPAAAPSGTGAARGGQAVPARQARDTRQALRRQSAAPPRSAAKAADPPRPAARGTPVRGQVMETRVLRLDAPARPVAGRAAGALGVGALMLLAIGAGALAEWRRGRRRRP
ncbi:hypothetical protein BKK81_29705 [Cupriavidus sp. USMAHM13]|uniref:cobaltochelatase subunit CobN n=1 Tax=Cupriavidus sp. USMAHM13 TaxID=1389192 RepID=UPI0008A694AA|nr:cobaltochelatase subunit CobN [Cupriavidus sp. USMAHM13]AOZ03272.1 hypothetical protein BKK81_29705 [Cupriavidus sp. USMAHM13]